MALPSFTMRQLLEAGAHFGHHTRRWNPKMEPFIFGIRNKIHIIDLQQTVPMLYRAMQAARDVSASGGRVLFVGTKRQASSPIAEAAKRCGQYYVNHRWLGGMLTNWKTVSVSIRRLRELDELLDKDEVGFTKKELLKIQRERDKLDRSLGGIRELGSLPDILFVIDTVKESIAVQEANKLGIPVVAIIDSNSDPDGIAYPIPGNDDSMRAIDLYCSLFADTILDGLQDSLAAAPGDLGAMEEAPVEVLPAETPKETSEEAAKTKASKAQAPKAKTPEVKIKKSKAPEAAAQVTPETPPVTEAAGEEKKAAPQKEAAKKEAPKKAEEKKAAPQKEAKKKEAAKKETKKAAAKKEADKKAAPKKAAAKKETAKKEAPKKEAKKADKDDKKAAPKKTADKKAPTAKK
ncbi:MAG: 30S ribosomal protein S2 [Alphaproteobacteria bacterium]|nr:30S ribosomal protein S2 [Alphaproteobacteria bacterium]